MIMQDYTYSQPVVSQAELSRRAARRFAVVQAARESRRLHARQPGLVRRFRHSVAGGLVATARLIDAT